MIKQVFAIRGATTAGDEQELIFLRTKELMREITARNGLDKPGVTVTSIICSSTADITEAYPAATLRDGGFEDTPLFSCLEPDIRNSLRFCIRLLVNVVSDADEPAEARHVYIHGAEVLRPDLIGK